MVHAHKAVCLRDAAASSPTTPQGWIAISQGNHHGLISFDGNWSSRKWLCEPILARRQEDTNWGKDVNASPAPNAILPRIRSSHRFWLSIKFMKYNRFYSNTSFVNLREGYKIGKLSVQFHHVIRRLRGYPGILASWPAWPTWGPYRC